VLLSWYYDQSRVLCSAVAVVLTVLSLGPLAGDSRILPLAALVLLPLNLILQALILQAGMKERGVMTLDGLVKVAILAVQAAGVYSIAKNGGPIAASLRAGAGADASLRWIPQVSFAIGALVLVALVVRRRTKVEQGLLWALAAMFFAVSDLDAALSRGSLDALFFYSGTAGLVLVFAVLEHGYDIAYRDELTGLPGRRAFNSVVEQLSGTYSIAMCDVDHFKNFNDTYGHDAGDQVLRMVASKLSQVGGGGRAFRYGGEEFMVLFRGRSARDAEPFVEALRRSVANAGFVLRSPDRPAHNPTTTRDTPRASTPRVDITISIGLADRSMRHSTPELVLDAADAALYRAKDAGRNCVKLDDSTPAAARAEELAARR
jgi:diguanylate cyclase (GGDEF)-like protein